MQGMTLMLYNRLKMFWNHTWTFVLHHNKNSIDTANGELPSLGGFGQTGTDRVQIGCSSMVRLAATPGLVQPQRRTRMFGNPNTVRLSTKSGLVQHRHLARVTLIAIVKNQLACANEPCGATPIRFFRTPKLRSDAARAPSRTPTPTAMTAPEDWARTPRLGAQGFVRNGVQSGAFWVIILRVRGCDSKPSLIQSRRSIALRAQTTRVGGSSAKVNSKLSNCLHE